MCIPQMDQEQANIKIYADDLIFFKFGNFLMRFTGNFVVSFREVGRSILNKIFYGSNYLVMQTLLGYVR